MTSPSESQRPRRAERLSDQTVKHDPFPELLRAVELRNLSATLTLPELFRTIKDICSTSLDLTSSKTFCTDSLVVIVYG